MFKTITLRIFQVSPWFNANGFVVVLELYVDYDRPAQFSIIYSSIHPILRGVVSMPTSNIAIDSFFQACEAQQDNALMNARYLFFYYTPPLDSSNYLLYLQQNRAYPPQHTE